MNFELKTDESSVLKTVFQIMNELSSHAYMSVTKDGLSMTCEKMDRGDVKMKFDVIPEKLLMFECYCDTFVSFHPSTFSSNLKKVLRSDTLRITGTDTDIELYSVNRKRDMSVMSVFRIPSAEFVTYSLPKKLSTTQGLLMNTKDFFTACENTNITPNTNSVTEFRRIGKYGLEISFETEFVSKCVTRLGDIDTEIIKGIFNTEHFSFRTQSIMMLKKLHSVSPKIRLYFDSSSRMIISASTLLGPLDIIITPP